MFWNDEVEIALISSTKHFIDFYVKTHAYPGFWRLTSVYGEVVHAFEIVFSIIFQPSLVANFIKRMAMHW